MDLSGGLNEINDDSPAIKLPSSVHPLTAFPWLKGPEIISQRNEGIYLRVSISPGDHGLLSDFVSWYSYPRGDDERGGSPYSTSEVEVEVSLSTRDWLAVLGKHCESPRYKLNILQYHYGSLCLPLQSHPAFKS